MQSERRRNWQAIILLGVLFVAALAVIGFTINKSPVGTGQSVNLINLSVIGISFVVLMVLMLAIIAWVFSTIDLSDKTQALGLPEGTIRAVIAFILLILFEMVPLFLIFNLKTDADPAVRDLSKQLITTLGTLVTAVVSFYFGAGTAKQALSGSATTAPTLNDVQPKFGKHGTPVSFRISGNNLELVTEARIVQGNVKYDILDITSNATLVKGTLTINPQWGIGKWDVVVETSEGRSAKLVDAFTITDKDASENVESQTEPAPGHDFTSEKSEEAGDGRSGSAEAHSESESNVESNKAS